MPKQSLSPTYIPPLWMGVGQGAAQFETKTASFAITAADSGKIFMVVGATANVAVTLPAPDPENPFHCRIIHLSDVTLTVSPAAVDTLYTFNDVAADSVALSTASELIGGEVEIFSNGVVTVALARISSPYQTVTVAT